MNAKLNFFISNPPVYTCQSEETTLSIFIFIAISTTQTQQLKTRATVDEINLLLVLLAINVFD